MSLPNPTLRMDLTGTAFGGAPTWTDYTSSLLGMTPVTVNWGRQDEQSEPQPAQCTFVLDNPTGAWTPGNAGAPAGWDVGARVNFRLTVSATVYDRFDGYIDAIEPALDGTWSRVQVSCSDVSARLGIAKPLLTFVNQEVKADGASYLYPLDEVAGAVSAGEALSNGPTAVLRSAARGPGTVTFGTDMGLLEGATGARFAATVPGDGAEYVTALSIPGAFPPGASGFTILMTVVMPSSLAATGNGLMSMDDGGAQSINLRSVPGPPAMQFDISSSTGGSVRSYGAALTDGGLHQFAMVLASDRKTQTLYQDGVAGTAAVAASAHTLTGLSSHVIGANFLNFNPSDLAMPLQGSIAMYAIVPSALSAAEILAIYQMTLGTFTERSDLRFSRVAGFGGITTSGLPTGLATTARQGTLGSTAIEALRTVARTEGGACFVTPAGALTFQGRQQRYHEAVGLTLTNEEVDPDFSIRRDRQGLTNQIAVTRPAGANQIVKDSTRQTADGLFDGDSFEVVSSTDEDALQNATWKVQTHKTPLTRLPSLTVDVGTLASSTTVQNCLAATISTKVQVTGLPTQAPASTFTGFIEGATETIGIHDWTMTFFTSPITLEDSVLVLDDATYGVLDTGILAF